MMSGKMLNTCMSMLYSLVSLVSKEINEIIACSVLCFIYKKKVWFIHLNIYIANKHFIKKSISP